MAMMFPELSKKTVHLGIGNGNWIEVDMLTVADLNEFQKIQTGLVKLKDEGADMTKCVEAVIEARAKLAEIAAKVIPSEFKARLQMMEYERLAHLVQTLCTGNDDGEKDDPEKKVRLPSQMVAPA